MKEFSVPMALVDLIPVALFAIGADTLAKDLKNRMSRIAFFLFAGGSGLVGCAGFFKAL